MTRRDTNFIIEFSGFNEGLIPLNHLDSDGFIGNRGQAGSMRADIISKPGFLVQAPGLSTLTNGDQGGVMSERIRFILDKPTTTTETYAMGQTKLFKLTNTTLNSGGSPSFPQTVSTMVSGESLIRLKGNLYGFYNTSSAGDILKMPLDTEVIDNDWGSTTDAALQNAPHPVAVKEDVVVFGNGQYAGVLIDGTSVSLDVDKLDFGAGSEVVDVCYNAGFWWIAVNSGEGKRGQIFVYEGGAQGNQLSDEVGVGDQQIGFLYVHNGSIYVAYEDKSSGGHTIGFIYGRQIKPLRYFTGSLPDHRKKALYISSVLFASSGDLMTMGSPVDSLPIQISTLADGGHDTIDSIACPFGVPIIASNDGSSNYRIAKLNGYSVNSNWKSLYVDVMKQNLYANITKLTIFTKPIPENASARIRIVGNQGGESSSYFTINEQSATRHEFRNIDLKACEDLRVEVDYANANTSATTTIRKIIVEGTFVEN